MASDASGTPMMMWPLDYVIGKFEDVLRSRIQVPHLLTLSINNKMLFWEPDLIR